tara:strand:+ start:104 stop:322 length:219 start_codon:yes stop_codon:yes gene_type:complete
MDELKELREAIENYEETDGLYDGFSLVVDFDEMCLPAPSRYDAAIIEIAKLVLKAASKTEGNHFLGYTVREY